MPWRKLDAWPGFTRLAGKAEGFTDCLVKWVTTDHLYPKGQGVKSPGKHPVTKCQCRRGLGRPPVNDGVLWACGPFLDRSFQLFKIHQKLSFN